MSSLAFYLYLVALIIKDILEDDHIWEVAKRITNKTDLNDLGLKVLKLEMHTIESALTNNTEIVNAAHAILQEWS